MKASSSTPGAAGNYVDPQAELRRQYVAAVAAIRRYRELHGSVGTPLMDFTPFMGLVCGAKGKRTGLPCPQKGLYGNGRCKWHGGLSTGPKGAGKRKQANGGEVAASPPPIAVTISSPSSTLAPAPAPAMSVHLGSAVEAAKPRVLDDLVNLLKQRQPATLTTTQLAVAAGIDTPRALSALRLLAARKRIRFVDEGQAGADSRWQAKPMPAPPLPAPAKLAKRQDCL
jgi:hypothetical protein